MSTLRILFLRHLTFFLFCLLGILILTNALTSHISESEFWPLTVSKEFWNPKTLEISLFYKPTFNGLLSLLHFLPMDSLSHVLTARLFFGTLAIITLFLMASWLKMEKPGNSLDTGTFFAILILISSPLYFSQFIKIRSDFLALLFFFLILFYVKKKAHEIRNYWLMPFKFLGGPTYFILTLLFLFLGTTPRSIVLMSFLFLSLLKFWGDDPQHRILRFKTMAIFAVPSFIITGTIFTFASGAGALLWTYGKKSFSQNSQYWGAVQSWVHSEPLLVLATLIALGYYFYRKQFWVVFTVSFGVSAIFISDLVTPFFLAAQLPFLLYPLLKFTTDNYQKYRMRILIFLGLLCFQNILSTHETPWWSSNKNQLEVITKITYLRERNTSWTYFDGLGILPRSDQLMKYLAPNDDVGLMYTRLAFLETKPDLVLYSNRLSLLGEDFIPNLLAQYREIAPNLYLKKSIETSERLTFKALPLVLFTLNPLPKNLTDPEP